MKTPKEKVGLWNQAGEMRLRAEMQLRESSRAVHTLPAIMEYQRPGGQQAKLAVGTARARRETGCEGAAQPGFFLVLRSDPRSSASLQPGDALRDANNWGGDGALS